MRDGSPDRGVEAEIAVLSEHLADLAVMLKHFSMILFGQDQALRYRWLYDPHRAFRAEETVGKQDTDLLPPAEAAVLTDLKRRVLETGTGTRARVRTKIDGRRHYHDLIVEPTRDEQGQITGIVGASLEITGRTEREREQLSRLAAAERSRSQARRAEAHYHQIATILQQSLLPAFLPELPGVQLSARYVPGDQGAQVGGDWYDVFQLPRGRLAVSVGDVMGRGLMAAILMGEVRQTLRVAALDAPTVAGVLIRGDHALRLSGRDSMVTTVFGVFDPHTHHLVYTNAGHPLPLIAYPDGSVGELPGGRIPLGVSAADLTIDWREWEIDLPAGSLVVFYTDGLIEQTRDTERGNVLLRDAVRAEFALPGRDPATGIVQRVLGGTFPSDDVAVLTMRMMDAAPQAGARG